MNLKRQIKAYIDERGITAAQLARRCGISKQTMSLWLGGSAPRNLDDLKKLAECLGTTVDHLCFGDGVDPVANRVVELDALLGSEWVSGIFEVRLRRIQKRN